MRAPKAKVEFDVEANTAYYTLRRGKVATTVPKRLDSVDVLLDYDSKGRLLGIEVLNMKKALERDLSKMGRNYIPKALAVAPRVR
jgi:uncharacterized protein YuzE